MDPLRVPAADCLRLFKPLAAGQLRRITWLAPVLLRLHEGDPFAALFTLPIPTAPRAGFRAPIPAAP